MINRGVVGYQILMPVDCANFVAYIFLRIGDRLARTLQFFGNPMQALTGLGKEAVLYIYPYEFHGPRCIETYMDLWARWVEWFDKYVKNPTEQ